LAVVGPCGAAHEDLRWELHSKRAFAPGFRQARSRPATRAEGGLVVGERKIIDATAVGVSNADAAPLGGRDERFIHMGDASTKNNVASAAITTSNVACSMPSTKRMNTARRRADVALWAAPRRRHDRRLPLGRARLHPRRRCFILFLGGRRSMRRSS
jgi:hypothetical protein